MGAGIEWGCVPVRSEAVSVDRDLVAVTIGGMLPRAIASSGLCRM